ncbi:MAG TPA: DNA polymerase Y family protein [Myxococcales bacterium]|nr:DNA polymerase Y family protein [Myxococcales bacterium]
MKIACLEVPGLSLVAALRAEPQLCGEPLAVVQAGRDLGGRARVLGATSAAQGVEVGQLLAEARAICPRLLTREASAERERAAAQAAREAAAAISPRVEEAGPGLVYLDASGLEALIGDDRAVARALVAAAERVGVRAAVGLASSKSVARLAARAAAADLTLEATSSGVGGGAFRVVPPEEQREFLAGLPLYALELPDELQESLRRFGLHSLGEVAALPPGPLAARLGPEAALLSRLARGEDASALTPRPQPDRFEEGEELEWDASSIEPLLFVWKALLDRLAQRLLARGLMARELLLELRLADGSWDERSLDLAAPTREVASLLQLLRLAVESRPPPAGVRAVRLSAVATREVLEQMALFGPRGASPTQLATAVARLSALVGPDRVGRPEAPDRWAPFAAECRKFAPPRAGAGGLPAAGPVPVEVSLAARALRPPRTADVRCDDAGNPLLVIGEGALGGRVVASAGPWRTVAEWWTEEPLALDAYDLELAGGLLIRAARELATGTWRIEAVYD